MTLPTIHATGRLTSDVELRFTGSGKAVASLSIACNESRKDQAGNWETVSTTFLDVDLWESEAEQAAEILRRGSEVTVDGQLQTEEYETKSGEKRRKMKIKWPKVTVPLPKPDKPEQASQDPWTADAPF